MTDLKLMQFLLKINHLILIPLDFLLILKRLFNLPLASIPNIFLLDIGQLPSQVRNNLLVIILLTSHLTCNLEDGIIIMLDSQMQVVHDVLGLLDISDLLS